MFMILNSKILFAFEDHKNFWPYTKSKLIKSLKKNSKPIQFLLKTSSSHNAQA